MSGVMNSTGAVSGILGTTVGTPESDNASALTTGTLPTARLPAGSVIQAKHFHYDGGLTIGTTSHSIPFTGTVDTGSPSLDFGCPITKSASSDIYISGIITHGFPDEDQWTRFRGFHSEDAGSNWVDFPINGSVNNFFFEWNHYWGDVNVRHPTWNMAYATILTSIGAGTVYVKIQCQISGGGSSFVNRGNSNSETDNTTITLMEIAR